jgi:NAD(P)-dependent dehydrogenase (short-subunit alcohol dehydrogenase family)
MDLTGQTAVVTGASSGIGLGISTVLAESGVDVAMWSRGGERLRSAASRVEQNGGGRTVFRQVDVRDRSQVDEAVAETVAELGVVTLLVNCAGTAGPAGRDWEVDADEWWECIETSVKGSFLCARAVLPAMIDAGSGRIIDLVSVTGTNAFPLLGATSVAKAALIRHVENLAAATAGTGVTVFGLHPGTVATALLDSYRSNPQMAAFLDGLPPSSFTDPGAVGRVVARIACGDLDPMSGCFVDATSDVDEALAEMDGVSGDAYRLRLVSP